MEHRLVSALDVPPRPWRNGGGITRELLAWPAAADWRVRVSVADITADGPFSAYPGVERWTAVLEGAGVELTIDGKTVPLRPGNAPLRFSGKAAVHCRLMAGPVRDLNLMLHGVAGGMEPAVVAADWAPPPSAAAGFFSAVPGRCAGIDMPGRALLWMAEPPPRMSFTTRRREAGAAGWWLAAAAGPR